MSYEHKQYGGDINLGGGNGIIATILSAVYDRLNAAAQRLAARIRGEQAEAQQAVSRGELVPVSDDTVEIGRDIDVLQERYGRITAQYEDILGQASQVNEVVRSVSTALVEATGNVETDQDVDVLKQRLDEYTDRWNALVARARELQDVAKAVQDKITEIEGQLDGKSAPRLDGKAFWDPEDDEDVAALTEKIDSLARRVERSIVDNDEDEQAEIMAELRDLDDGLTDDTRFRVQALIERLGGGEKSAPPPGAHAHYR